MDYFLKSSAIIALFFFAYKLVLQHETFFQSNRWFLLTGIGLAVFIPLIVIPIYVEYVPETVNTIIPLTTSTEVINTPEKTTIDFWQLLTIIYAIGVIFFLSKLCIELTSLQFLFKRHDYYKSDAFFLIETNADIPPFSFFNWIVFNPEKYSKEELNHILNHEKAHAKQLHSIDIILTQLACILFWFNPFIWLYKKEMQQNLEFIADQKAQDFSKCEKSYQLVLLKSSTPQHKFLITNNFYNSQIKKRIVMLHKSKSNKINVWKYGLILPVLAIFLISFNTKTIFVEIESPIVDQTDLTQSGVATQLNSFYEAIEKTPIPKKIVVNTYSPKPNTKITSNTTLAKVAPQKHNNDSKTKKEVSVTMITKNTTDLELNDIKAKLEKEGLTTKIKGVKRNKADEITAIKIEVSSKKSSTNYNISSDEAIKPIKIVYDSKNKSISIGNSHAGHGNNTFIFKSKDGKHKIHRSSNSNVFVYSDDEHDGEHEHEIISIKRKGKKGKKAKVRKIKRSKNVQVISDDGEVIEVIVEGEGDNENVFEIIVDEDDEGNEIEEKIIIKGKGNDKSVWISNDGGNDDDDDDVIILKNSGSNIFISPDDDKKALIIIDGKESTREALSKLSPDDIATIDVHKGKKAIEKYGDKAKNGVINVITKKKN